MNPLIHAKRATLICFVALACFGLSPVAHSQCPTDCDATGNTAIGIGALRNNTTGVQNTAVGADSLFRNTAGLDNTANGNNALTSNTTGSNNTATGSGALVNNNANNNTAVGADALFRNTAGFDNTANGTNALLSNTVGTQNTASGSGALHENIAGSTNTATGTNALFNNNGNHNTANGVGALQTNTGGSENTAMGGRALFSNTSGNFNTAVGFNALSNATGLKNVAIGHQAGIKVTTGSNNIDIGTVGGSGDSNTIRIGGGDLQTRTFVAGISGSPIAGTSVVVNNLGRLGTVASSARFKEEIKPMDKASEAVLALKPVTFRYKKEIDPAGTSQFGLVAEDVEKINPDLVVRDKKGKPYSVRYDQVNAMLLNEFLKEHRKVQEQEATIAKLKKDFRATVAQLTTRLDEQAAQIQKVSAQLEASKPAPQTVLNSQ
jgi:hypothetical protein